MNTQQKGFSSTVLLIVLLVVVAGVAGYFVITQKSTAPENGTNTDAAKNAKSNN